MGFLPFVDFGHRVIDGCQLLFLFDRSNPLLDG
jgi:hypothetical protein